MSTLALASGPAIQRRCALYRHFDDNDVLLYVGITDSLGDRTNSGHARTSDWVQFAVRAEAEWHDSREQASAEERDAVENEHPIFNRQYAVGDVDRKIADYLHEREVRSLNGAISFYENTVRQFLGTVPEQLLKEVEGAALAMYRGSGVSDERVFPAFLLNDLNFASRRRVASARDDAALAAYQAVVAFIGKQREAICDPWAAAEEPPF